MSSPERKDSEALCLKELEVEVLRLSIKEKEVSHEFELRKIEEETKRQVRLKELELQHAAPVGSSPLLSSPLFDVNKCVKFIPPFSEKDIDKYFVLFERAAEVLQWPKAVWPLLLQTVCTGTA